VGGLPLFDFSLFLLAGKKSLFAQFLSKKSCFVV